MTKLELVEKCKERGIKYSSKTKPQLIALLQPVQILNGSTHSQSTLKMIDLFAGTGAFTHAFQNQGVECVFANDMVGWSKTIYDANFSHKLTLGNLNTLNIDTIPAHDILTGGFPCQPFSIAGKQQGIGDP